MLWIRVSTYVVRTFNRLVNQSIPSMAAPKESKSSSKSANPVAQAYLAAYNVAQVLGYVTQHGTCKSKLSQK